MRYILAVILCLVISFAQAAAPTVVGTVNGMSYNGGGGSATNDISVPTNIAGDLLVIVVNGRDGGAGGITTPPTGYTEFLTDDHTFAGDSGVKYFSQCFWKVSGGSEGSTVTLTSSAFTPYKAQMMVVRGAAVPTDIAIVAGFDFDATADTDNISPSITVTHNESLVVRAVMERQGACTFTPPSGYTEVYDDNATYGSATIAVDEANAGATGTATFVNSAGWPASFVLPAFALAPAAADLPTISTSATQSLEESERDVVTVAATGGATPYVWSITGGADQALFAINSSTGALTMPGSADFETPEDADTNNVYVVEVTCTDDDSATDALTINVTVTDEGGGSGFAVDPLGGGPIP